MRVALNEQRWKRRLVEQVAAQSGHRALDLGCGSATLTMMLKRAYPGAAVVGLDGDPRILDIARRKLAGADVEVELREGMAFDPSFPDGSFDRVVSSLMLHHLTTADKERTLQRAFALLRPGGEIHIADWGRPQNALLRVGYLAVQLIDGFETTRDNLQGRLPDMLRTAGFTDVTEIARQATIFGTISLFRGRRPA